MKSKIRFDLGHHWQNSINFETHINSNDHAIIGTKLDGDKESRSCAAGSQCVISRRTRVSGHLEFLCMMNED